MKNRKMKQTGHTEEKKKEEKKPSKNVKQNKFIENQQCDNQCPI